MHTPRTSLKTLAPALALAALALLDGCGGSSTSQKTVTVGAWGRDAPTRVELDVTATGATLDDPANLAIGTIPEPITIGGSGHFSAEGTLSYAEGPPPTPGARPRAGGLPCRFSGTVSGNTMTLSYTRSDGTYTVGPYTLTYGKTENP